MELVSPGGSEPSGSWDTRFSQDLRDPLLEEHPSEVAAQSRNRASTVFHDAKEYAPVEFPPLFAISLGVAIGIGVVGLFFLLSLTLARGVWESAGVSSGDLLDYGSIPLISTGFTYCHIWLALWLTFYPLEFFGFFQIPGTNVGLGWQGIVPSRAAFMAKTTYQLMREQDIMPSTSELCSRLEPELIWEELKESIGEKLPKIVEQACNEHIGTLWSYIPEDIRLNLIQQGVDEAPDILGDMTKELVKKVEDAVDVEAVLVKTFVAKKQLLCDMFIDCGCQELCFLRASGAFWGGVFGVIQMLLWLNPSMRVPLLVFPTYGFIVGGCTNWFALKMIFSPINPVDVCGLKLQGLFLQRQKEVSSVFAHNIANKVMTTKNIISMFCTRPVIDILAESLCTRVHQTLDEMMPGSGYTLPLINATTNWRALKTDLSAKLCKEIPISLACLEEYAEDAIGLEKTLKERMADIPSEQFERLLHPVFEQDEWKLILMGAVLGFFIGMFQATFIN